jgi:hypothetical protein
MRLHTRSHALPCAGASRFSIKSFCSRLSAHRRQTNQQHIHENYNSPKVRPSLLQQSLALSVELVHSRLASLLHLDLATGAPLQLLRQLSLMLGLPRTIAYFMPMS